VTACPLFIELCAGTAAVSLRLARARARPPVSRMGSKAGWGDTLLGLAGLRPGQGAGHYLWCEPDPGCRLLLEAYRDAALARAAADIIRGWAGEDPRALWERLRAEGPPRGPEASPGGQVFAHEVARWLYGSAANYSPRFPFDGYLDPEQGGRYGAGRLDVARKTAALPTLPATIAPDVRAVDPREVARAIITGQWAYRRMEPASGWCSVRVPRDDEPIMEGDRKPARNIAADVGALDTLPATILSDAHAADPGPALPAGTVALFDPPYQGTTPYAHDLPRADVVAIARRWAAAGALVMVCEQEPIPELLADGWVYRDIAHARKGQARTFSRQSREVVTMNRAPVHVPAEQVGLFGGAR
jgi:hypothetical protein